MTMQSSAVNMTMNESLRAENVNSVFLKQLHLQTKFKHE